MIKKPIQQIEPKVDSRGYLLNAELHDGEIVMLEYLRKQGRLGIKIRDEEEDHEYELLANGVEFIHGDDFLHQNVVGNVLLRTGVLKLTEFEIRGLLGMGSGVISRSDEDRINYVKQKWSDSLGTYLSIRPSLGFSLDVMFTGEFTVMKRSLRDENT